MSWNLLLTTWPSGYFTCSGMPSCGSARLLKLSRLLSKACQRAQEMKNPSTLGSIKKQRSYTMPLCVFCKRLLRCAVPGPVEEERGKKSKFMRIYNHIHTGKTTFYKHVPTLSWSVCRLSRYSSSCLARSARHSCKSYKATLTNVKNIQCIYDWHWFIFKVPRLKLKKEKLT